MTAAIPSDIQTTFKADWPRHLDPAFESTLSKVKRILWNVISIILFPIGLCRLMYWGLRNLGLRIVVPGPPFLNSSNANIYLQYFNGHNVKLTSPDRLKLDGALFPGQYRDRAVIFSPGNAMSWEAAEMYIRLLKPLNVSILLVNPRGIVKSEGSRDEDGFALDIYTAYEYLIKEEKIDPNNIVQVGFSMGGGYGACGAAIAQKQYPNKDLSAMNIRSFSDLELEVKAVTESFTGLLGVIARLGHKLVTFNIPAKKALDTLKGRVCVVTAPSDGIIFKVARMIEAMRNDPKRKITHIQLHGDHTVSGEAHIRDFTPDERLAILEELRQMLHLREDELDQKMMRIFRREAESFKGDPRSDLFPLKIEQVG